MGHGGGLLVQMECAGHIETQYVRMLRNRTLSVLDTTSTFWISKVDPKTMDCVC